jgi:hypothetical protein
MAQARQDRTGAPAPVRKKMPIVPGPLLPGEFRPIAPTPAASEPSGLAAYSEGELLKALVTYHQWFRLDPVTIRRYSRHNGAAALAVGAAFDA